MGELKLVGEYGLRCKREVWRVALTLQDFLERRLQTLVHKHGLAKSIHHARTMIRQRHISVGKQMVTVPSFWVRTDSEKHIVLHPRSSLADPNRPGRVKRTKAKGGKKEDDE